MTTMQKNEKDADLPPICKDTWEEALGRELTATVESFSKKLLRKDKALIQIIFAYVFKNADNEDLLHAILTRITKDIPSFHPENLEILFLSLEGARMLVEENKLNPKTFSDYMVAKKFKVKEKIIAYQEKQKNRKKRSSLKTAYKRKGQIKFKGGNSF